jgi:hypothetical protein
MGSECPQSSGQARAEDLSRFARTGNVVVSVCFGGFCCPCVAPYRVEERPVGEVVGEQVHEDGEGVRDRNPETRS